MKSVSNLDGESPPKTQLQSLREESESGSPSNTPKPALDPSMLPVRLNGRNTINEDDSMKNADSGDVPSGDPASNEGEMMKATMTDVQKAIEQLGRSKHDPDGTRSFSFASTRDGDHDTENETETDTDFDMDATKGSDAEGGENWHKGARRKLAEKARRAVQEAEKLEMMMNGLEPSRNVAPPIKVQVSDESEGEDDQPPGNSRRYDLQRQTYIPEEDEGEEKAESIHVLKERPAEVVEPQEDKFSATSIPRVRDNSDLPTATAVQPSFSVSSVQVSAAPSQASNHEEKMSLPTPITPSGPNSSPTSVKATPAETVVSLPSPIASSVGLPQHIFDPLQSSRLDAVASKVSGLPQSGLVAIPTVPAQSVPVIATTTTNDNTKKENKQHPSDWSVDDVVEWLKSKGFDQDVCDKFIGT
jgi:hypothetical protein